MKKEAKKQFLWGSATAAYQCEGAWNVDGKGESNWDEFSHTSPLNINHVTGDKASNHYYNYKEDIRAMKESNQNAYRFSIAWTRIIPDGTGDVNQKGIDYYNDVINTCLENGIEPIVTLYHYDMPLPLFHEGGWENRDIVDAYVTYTKVCFAHFGDRVKYWTTINEPGFDSICSYIVGNYPPHVQDLGRRWKALYHMLLASAGAIREYHDLHLAGKIGIVSDSYAIEILKHEEAYEEAKANAEWFYNRCINDVCVYGVIPQELIDMIRADYDISYMREEDREIFRQGTVDFLGINAYYRILVKPYTQGETCFKKNNTGDGSKHKDVVKHWFELDDDPSTVKSSWGVEVYPKSVYDLLMRLKELYPHTPIIITENGIGYDDVLKDNTVEDDYRIDYCQGFIKWIYEAMKEGCNVLGYMIWSTFDLYSWVNGYRKRYGLVYIDFENDKHYPKKSYYWYRDYIETNKEAYDRLVAINQDVSSQES